MNLIRLPDIASLAQRAASLAAEKIQHIASKKATVVLGLAGGRSVGAIYEILAGMDMSVWPKVHFFLVDERRVAPDDPDSNFRLVNKTLFAPLLSQNKIRNDQIHRMETELDPVLAADRYTDGLKKLGGIFDLAILSSGEDNHVAGIFPDRAYPDSSGFVYFNDSPKPPAERFSATPALLSRTPSVLVIFSGENKRDALEHLLDRNVQRTTAETVLDTIGDLAVITDMKD